MTGCSGVLHSVPGDVSHGGAVWGIVSSSYTDKGGVGGTPALTTINQHNIRQKHNEVEFAVNQSGTNVAADTDTSASHRGSLSPGDWIELNGPLNLTNISSISYRVADAAAGRTAGSPLAAVEIRQDNPTTGPILQTNTLVSTGGTGTWTTQTFPITMTGTHRFYLVFRTVTDTARPATTCSTSTTPSSPGRASAPSQCRPGAPRFRGAPRRVRGGGFSPPPSHEVCSGCQSSRPTPIRASCGGTRCSSRSRPGPTAREQAILGALASLRVLSSRQIHRRFMPAATDRTVRHQLAALSAAGWPARASALRGCRPDPRLYFSVECETPGPSAAVGLLHRNAWLFAFEQLARVSGALRVCRHRRGRRGHLIRGQTRVGNHAGLAREPVRRVACDSA